MENKQNRYRQDKLKKKVLPMINKFHELAALTDCDITKTKSEPVSILK